MIPQPDGKAGRSVHAESQSRRGAWKTVPGRRSRFAGGRRSLPPGSRRFHRPVDPSARNQQATASGGVRRIGNKVPSLSRTKLRESGGFSPRRGGFRRGIRDQNPGNIQKHSGKSATDCVILGAPVAGCKSRWFGSTYKRRNAASVRHGGPVYTQRRRIEVRSTTRCGKRIVAPGFGRGFPQAAPQAAGGPSRRDGSTGNIVPSVCAGSPRRRTMRIGRRGNGRIESRNAGNQVAAREALKAGRPAPRRRVQPAERFPGPPCIATGVQKREALGGMRRSPGTRA